MLRAMFFLAHTPAPTLRDFVDRFWLCSDAPSHDRERILPGGTVELVINLREDEVRIYDPDQPERVRRLAGAVVSGTYARPFVIDPRQHASIIGVHFQPGGAFPFLGPRADELANDHVDLVMLWGRAAGELRERLCEAASAAERFAIMEQTLLRQLARPLKRHAAVYAALRAFEQSHGCVDVRRVARQVELSDRRFIEVFAAEVGLTPKRFCRILRFQHARAEIGRNSAPDWAALALECGYFDQSHLIHDFREFSGMSPTTYARQQNQPLLPNHVLFAA